ncbi:polysaccharide deacetylase family protein [Soonwooa sp.]|uniref:polysaccharide deacetylase family protein n=1 Tax=Soonwooa sp. TaxID=1938592 RepID=UPI0026107236|nr:polysaccharide deacetylase family protein [Soonwooa sp.]
MFFFIVSAKSIFYKSASTLLNSFSLKKLAKYLPYRDVVIVYHSVSDEKLKHAQHLFPYRSSKAFVKDLDELSKDFDFIDWNTFLERKNTKNKTGKPKLLLTFDDGYSDFYDVIAPILKQKGIYATNFINPKFIDNKDLMWRCKASLLISEIADDKDFQQQVLGFKNLKLHPGLSNLKEILLSIKFENQHLLDELATFLNIDFKTYLAQNKVYLTTDELLKLKQDGFGISAHGWDHPLYHELSLDAQLDNTQKALDFLENLGLNSDSFAFPFTDFGIKNEFFEKLSKANPQLQYAFGAAGLKLDSRFKNLQRIPLEVDNYSAKQVIKNEIVYFNLLKLFNKHRI